MERHADTMRVCHVTVPFVRDTFYNTMRVCHVTVPLPLAAGRSSEIRGWVHACAGARVRGCVTYIESLSV